MTTHATISAGRGGMPKPVADVRRHGQREDQLDGGAAPGRVTFRFRPLLALCFLLPFLMGGCPEFRNDLVSVFETATRSALLGTADEQAIADTVTVSLVEASIDLLFDQFRPSDFN